MIGARTKVLFWIAILLAFGLAAAAAPTLAQNTAAPQADAGLRGPIAAPAAPPQRAPDPALELSLVDPAPRQGPLATDAQGGADCRTTCAKTYYLCLAADDQDRCSTAWVQCLTACPASSGKF